MKNTIILFITIVFLSTTMQAQTVTDIDGSIYNTISIGSQVWTKENLKVTHYANGDLIPNVMVETDWSNLTTGALCYWGIDSTTYAPIYGALYNWYAVDDSRNLCPANWHVPSNSEWNIMTKFLDNTVDTSTAIWPIWLGTDIGLQLKDTSLLWSGGGGSNISNFSGLPGGSRHNLGIFSCVGSTGSWWTSTDVDTVAWYRSLTGIMPTVMYDYVVKGVGVSVRCIKDSLANKINENSIDNDFHIFPNPVINSLSIQTTQKSSIEISNIQGQIIKTTQSDNLGITIDVSILSSGIYLLKSTSSKGIVIKKFIKE
jgi:uncharacterized protein (TIGR02145 family)